MAPHLMHSIQVCGWLISDTCAPCLVGFMLHVVRQKLVWKYVQVSACGLILMALARSLVVGGLLHAEMGAESFVLASFASSVAQHHPLPGSHSPGCSQECP